MALPGQRRPLVQTAQNNLQSLQAAHRQKLQAAAKQRPPQLPNALASSFTSESSGGSSSRVHNNIKEARSFSAEAFGHSSPLASPSGSATGGLPATTSSSREEKRHSRPESEASSRTTPRRAASPSHRISSRKVEPVDFELPRWNSSERPEVDDDEDFAAELDDLEDLCRNLNMRGSAGSDDRRMVVDTDPRPLTGGTSASTSTTAPGGSSKDFEVASLDFEGSQCELANETDNPFDSLRGGPRAAYELQQGRALPHGCRIEKTPGASAQFFFSVDAAEGPYVPATLTFWIKVFDEFPAADGLSIRCTKRIFHPNIDQDSGHLKLQPDATGGQDFKDVLVAIHRVVTRPTDSPAVNADAAMLLQTDPQEFRRVVRTTLGGGEYRGVKFDKVLDFTKKSIKTPDAPQAQMSDQMRCELMKLDVLQAKFTSLADSMIKGNNDECRDLEYELDASRAS